MSRPAILVRGDGVGSLACWRGDCERCPKGGPAIVKHGVEIAPSWVCTHRCHALGSA